MFVQVPLKSIKRASFIVCCIVIMHQLCFEFQNSYIGKLLRLANGGSSMKYILVWTSEGTKPLKNLRGGQKTFINRNCRINNCYVTWDRQYLTNITYYDAIIFDGPEITRSELINPSERSPKQLYIFASIESPKYYPLSKNRFDDFFNVTWTHRLDSDIYFGYIVIRNAEGEVVGPKENMTWIKMEEMSPVDTTKDYFKEKIFLGAWFVSNCKSLSRRHQLVHMLQIKLKTYLHYIDVFGACSIRKCPIESEECSNAIRKYYFFYFALENSFAKDYVTEKLLRALQNYAIPVVYGGADYRRFMPDGIYLDAKNLTTDELVRQMLRIIHVEHNFTDYFRWRNHYSYHSSEDSYETDPYCKLCEYINTFNGTKIVHDIASWWNQ